MPLLDDLRLPPSEAEVERRRFLGLLGSGALGIAVVGTGISAVRFLEPNVVYEPDTRFVIGRPEDIAVGTVLVLLRQKVYVIRNEHGFYALSSVCTHLGCMTRHDAADAGFSCPCHGSRFQLDGTVRAGPAPRPLPHVELTIERGHLVVNSDRVVADDHILRVA